MKTIGTLAVPQARQARWKRIELQREWAARYPHLFDDEDIRLATGLQGKRGFHFMEWLGAMVVSDLTGFHALISKYQYPKHERKRQVVATLALKDLLRLKHPTFGGTQGPDLLMFLPDYSDYFFCEVKGPGDTLKATQEEYFRYLEDATGRAVRLLQFKWATVPRVGA